MRGTGGKCGYVTLMLGWNWLPYLHLRHFHPPPHCANVLSTTSKLFSTDWGLLWFPPLALTRIPERDALRSYAVPVTLDSRYDK